MLDERKVKLMTQLALYDQTQGKEDFKISEYYRKDYAGVHILYTVLWVTIGYIAAWAIAMIAGLDTLMEKMSTALLITFGSRGSCRICGSSCVLYWIARPTCIIKSIRKRDSG